MYTYLGDEAVPQLCAYCAQNGLERFRLVADERTYAALGEKVEQALRGQGWQVQTIVLPGAEIVDDEASIMDVLARADAEERMWISVGSGTITDLVRFVSHRSRAPFIAMATAPSMDGYLSAGSPLVLRQVKQTFQARPPRLSLPICPRYARRRQPCWPPASAMWRARRRRWPIGNWANCSGTRLTTRRFRAACARPGNIAWRLAPKLAVPRRRACAL